MKKIIIALTLFIIAGSQITATVDLATAESTTMPSIPKSELLPGPDETSTQDEIQGYFREKALPSFISGFIGIVGVASFISLLISGIQFLTAYGNDEKLGTAKKTAIYAITGFIIAIFSYAIVSIISSLPISEDEETASLFSIPVAYAEEIDCSKPETLTADQKLDCLLPSQTALIEESPNSQGSSLPSGDLIEDTIPKVVKLILFAVSLAVLATIVYAGILLVIARGNEESIKKGQNMLLYAAIGVIIIGIAYALVYGLSQLSI